MKRVTVKKPTNVSLDVDLVAAARELSINVSRACEAGLAREVKQERERRFLEENRAAMDAYNAWIEEHGMPLADIQVFKL